MASATEINRLDVTIEVNARKANTALLTLAKRLDLIGQYLDDLVKKTNGIAAIGTAAENAVEKMSSIGSATKKAGNEAVIAAKKTSEIGKAAEAAAEKVDSLTNSIKNATGTKKKMTDEELAEYRKLFQWHGERTDPSVGLKDRVAPTQPKDAGAGLFSEQQKAINADYNEATKYYKAAQAARDHTKALYERITAQKLANQDTEDEIANLEKQAQALARINAENQRSVTVFATVTSAVGRLVGGYTNLIIKMEMLPFRALTKLPGIFRSATSAVVKFGKALAHPVASLKELLGVSKKAGSGILGGLLGNKSLAKYVGLIALRRAVTGAIRAIVKGIKEGFENVMKYSSEIKSSIYSVQNSLLYLKNAWAAAFAPIITAVAPYVDALIDIIASALNAIGRLIAMLTGKGFAVQAKKLSDSLYEQGKAGEEAGKGAGKAAKAAEEYKKTIMGFDQLNVLNDPDSGSGGSGGGGGSGSGGGFDANSMFETVELTGSLKDYIDAGNWDEVGAYFADKINGFFTKVDNAIKWDTVGGKITSVINALTTTVNSLVDNVNWGLVGTTVADGLTTLVKAYNLLFDGLNFDNMGSSAAEAVMNFVSGVPWNEVGAALVQKFNAIWSIGGSFVSGLDFAKIGTALGNALTGAAKKIDLAKVGKAISDAINGITVAISKANFTFNSDLLLGNSKMKGQIAELINNAIGGIEANEIADAMKGLAQKIGNLLATSLSAFFSSGGVTKLSAIFAGAIDAVSISIKHFKMNMDWEAAETDIKTAITTLFTRLSKSDFLDNAADVALNIVQAIANAVSDPEATQAISDFGEKLGESLAKLPWLQILANLAGAIIQALTSLLEGALTGLRRGILKKFGLSDDQIEIYEQGTADLSDTVSAIENGTYNDYESGKKKGAAYSQGYTDGIKDGTPAAKKESEKLAKETYDGMGVQGEKGTKKGKAFAGGVNNGMTLWEKKLKQKANYLSATIYDGMGKQGERGQTKGSAFGSGVATGLENSKKGVNKKATELGEGAAQAYNQGIRNIPLAKLEFKLNYTTLSNGAKVPTSSKTDVAYERQYATGGFPKMGELFLAREQGPELVGRMGNNRNAVANNEQIIEGIKSGVYQAMMNAMASSSSSGGNGMPYEINVTVKTQNDEVLARAVERGQAKRKYRLGMAMG